MNFLRNSLCFCLNLFQVAYNTTDNNSDMETYAPSNKSCWCFLNSWFYEEIQSIVPKDDFFKSFPERKRNFVPFIRNCPEMYLETICTLEDSKSEVSVIFKKLGKTLSN